MGENTSSPLKWYQKGWSVVLFGFALLVTGIIVSFVAITFHYWWQIKHGDASALSSEFTSPYFTKSVKNATFIDSSKIDRNVLEQGDYQFGGSSQPKVTIVEFADFKCPFCRESAPIIDQIMQRYGNKVKFIVRHFPVESIHPGATRLAGVAYCAGKQGRFWPVYRYLYSNQDSISEIVSAQEIEEITKANDLDLKKLQTCMDSPATTIAINKDYADGFNSGVQGTPTFFVNGEAARGVISWNIWEAFLKSI
jgi:protein-disulfide isomerase